MSDDVLPECLHLLALCDVLKHDLGLLMIVQLIVLVVAHLFQKEAVTRSQTYIHVIVSESVLQEFVIKVASEHLDDATDHLSDLVIEKSLTLQEEMNEFDCSRVLLRSHFPCISVYVHIGVCFKFQHVADGRHLMRLHLFRVVVIFF